MTPTAETVTPPSPRAEPEHAPPTPERRLLTIADVAALPTDLPTGDVRYELEEGTLIIMPPAAADHGRAESNAAYLLNLAGRKVGGEVFSGKIGLVLGRGPDTLFGGDAAYFAPASLPLRLSPEGYIETPPDLVVEIRSKNERPGRVAHKVERYLAAGAKEVWYVEPSSRSVVAYRPGMGPQRYADDDVLTTDLIPGCEFPLGELFD